MTADDVYEMIERLNQQVEALYQQGRYKHAIDIAAQVRDVTRQHLGKDHSALAASLNNLALLYQDVGNYA